MVDRQIAASLSLHARRSLSIDSDPPVKRKLDPPWSSLGVLLHITHFQRLDARPERCGPLADFERLERLT